MNKKVIFWSIVAIVGAGIYVFVIKPMIKGTSALANGTSVRAKNAMNIYDESFKNIIRSKPTGEWAGDIYDSATYNGELWYRAYDSNKGKITFKASDVEPVV